MAAPTLQTYGPGNIDELLATTLPKLLPGIRDNVFSSNPMLKWMNGKGRLTVSGGASLSHGIMYEANSGATSYQRYDTLVTTPVDGLTRDQWDWTQYAVPVTVDGFTERVANAGEAKIEDIVAAKKRQSEESLSLKLEQHLFAASPGSKDLRSLPVIVLASGTEGDINGTTNSWWQSVVTASGSWVAQGQSDLENLLNTLSIRNPSGPSDLIMSDQTSYQFYKNSMTAQKRFMDMKADAGFTNVLFNDIPWTWSPQANSGVIYVLNSKALEFVVHSETDFLFTEFRKPTNQDAKVAHILLACALISAHRRKLGKMTGVTA